VEPVAASRRRWCRVIDAILWAAYALIPGRVGGVVQGVLIGAAGTCVLVAVAWLLARGRSLPGARIAASVSVLTLVLGATITADRGFRARYFADADARGPIERSTDFRSTAYTRIDERLDFGRSRDFPLWFFNDIARFNFASGSGTDRQHLPFAVVWEGQWRIDRADTRWLYLDAPGALAELVVDNSRVAAVAPGNEPGLAAVSLTKGFHRLFIRYTSPYGSPRRFSAGEMIEGRRVPFEAGAVVTRSLEAWQGTLATLLRIGKTIFDVGVLIWMALLVGRDLVDLRRGRRADGTPMTVRQQTLAWFALVAIVDAFAVASPWLTRLWLLAGGDDPLTYEAYARDIQLRGLLLRSVDGPYYYQVLYPYFLAATHRLFGEGMFGCMFVQRLLQASVAWNIVRIATAVAGAEVWPAALGFGAFFAYAKLSATAGAQSSESLFIPLLVAWIAAIVDLARPPSLANDPGELRRTRRSLGEGGEPSVARAALAGLLGGLAALTRTTALLGWIVVGPVCWLQWRRTAGRARPLVVMIACAAFVMSFISLRNAIVVHRFVPMPTEFGITLLGGNEPPPGFTLDNSARAAVYERLHISPMTGTVIEYAVAAPGQFAANMRRKALFALGFYEPYAPGFGYAPLLIAIWVAALAGLGMAIRAGVVPTSVAALPALVALTQCAAVVIVYPKGERLILPFYSLLVPYAAITIDRVVRTVVSAAARLRSEAIAPGAWLARALGVAALAAVAVYTLAIRTRGITDHFLMLSEQIRDWQLALGPFSSLPRVGTPSTVGGNSLGPIYYWILWLSRVLIGPAVDNLPHAGGIGLAATQSIADVVLCAGIRKASGSWIFAIAAVLLIASAPFDLALSAVIWNPVVAIAFAKIATGLVLYWQSDLTRMRRLVLTASAWFAVQAHSGALPFAGAIFLWILWSEFRHGGRRLAIAAAEIALAVVLLQTPSFFAPASAAPPNKMLAALRHPEPLRIGDAFRAVCAAIESIGFAPLPVSQTSMIVLSAAAATLLVVGPQSALAAITALPIGLAVGVWSLWQEDYDAYRFLTIVPAGLLMVLWTLRIVPQRAARPLLALALLVFALAVQKPRIDNSALVFRMPGYGAIVRGSRDVIRRGEPVRHIEAPWLHPLSDPEYVYTLLGGHLTAGAAVVAHVSDTGEVTYVH